MNYKETAGLSMNGGVIGKGMSGISSLAGKNPVDLTPTVTSGKVPTLPDSGRKPFRSGQSSEMMIEKSPLVKS